MDLYLDKKQIPAGSNFYVYSDRPQPRRAETQVISGFGSNLTIGIRVSEKNPLDYTYLEESMFLPFDALQLAD